MSGYNELEHLFLNCGQFEREVVVGPGLLVAPLVQVEPLVHHQPPHQPLQVDQVDEALARVDGRREGHLGLVCAASRAHQPVGSLRPLRPLIVMVMVMDMSTLGFLGSFSR